MALEKQKRLQTAALKTGYTINTLGEGKASRAETNIRQVESIRDSGERRLMDGWMNGLVHTVA